MTDLKGLMRHKESEFFGTVQRFVGFGNSLVQEKELVFIGIKRSAGEELCGRYVLKPGYSSYEE